MKKVVKSLKFQVQALFEERFLTTEDQSTAICLHYSFSNTGIPCFISVTERLHEFTVTGALHFIFLAIIKTER